MTASPPPLPEPRQEGGKKNPTGTQSKGDRQREFPRMERAMVGVVAVTLMAAAWGLSGSPLASPPLGATAPLNADAAAEAAAGSRMQLVLSRRRRDRLALVKNFLSTNHTSPQLLRLPNRGFACSFCCVYLDRPASLTPTPQNTHTRYLSEGYHHQTVWATPAKKMQVVVSGLTHVVWMPPFANTLFATAEAANSWRTLSDLQGAVSFDRTLITRPAGTFYWMFRHLTGYTASPRLQIMPRQQCFQKLMFGSAHFNWQPYNLPTLCARPIPEFNKAEAEWLGRYRQHIHSKLPTNRHNAPAGDLQSLPCTAVVQLRGGPGTVRPLESRGRNFVNSEEVIRALQSVGFQVDPVDLRQKGTVSAALAHHAAHVVVAPHGAGMANLIFSQANATLLELHNWGSQNYVYERYVKTFGLDYVPLYCKDQDHCPVNMQLWRREFGRDAARPPAASEDLCQRGVATAEKVGYYATNHTLRDIRADVDALSTAARSILSRLTAEGRCRAAQPP